MLLLEIYYNKFTCEKSLGLFPARWNFENDIPPIRQSALLPVFYVGQTSAAATPLLNFKPLLSVAPEEHPRAHTHVARATLEVPLVHRVVRATTPDEVATLADTALPAVWVSGGGMTEPV